MANAVAKSAVKAPSKKKTTTSKKSGTVKEITSKTNNAPKPEVTKEPKVIVMPNKNSESSAPEKVSEKKEKKAKTPKVRQPSTKTRGLINNRKIGVKPGDQLVFRPNDNIKVTAMDDIRTFDVNGQKVWGISIAEGEAYKLANLTPPKRLYGWAWDRLNEDGTRTPVKTIFESLPVESEQDPAMAEFKDKKDSPVWKEELATA